MAKFLAIFRHEWARHVLRKRFVLVLLSVPAYLVGMFLLAAISLLVTFDLRPVGYVDLAGVIVDAEPPGWSVLSYGPLRPTFLPFPSEAEGRAALEQKRIQGLYILPADFLRTQRARLLVIGEMDLRTRVTFHALLRGNLLRGQPEMVRRAVLLSPTFELHPLGKTSGLAGANPLRILAPFAAGFLLVTALLTTGGYLVQAVVEEKENRTMEVLVTSAAPEGVINAKLAALLMVGLTQLVFWLAPPLALLWLAQAAAPLDLPPFNLNLTLLALLTILPTLVALCAVLAMIAVTLTEVREGQQLISVVSTLALAPLFSIVGVMASPESPLAVWLSFFPPSAALTLITRAAYDAVSPAQILLSGLMLSALAALAVLVLGRVFRGAMLFTGSRLAFGRVLLFVLPERLSAWVEREGRAWYQRWRGEMEMPFYLLRGLRRRVIGSRRGDAQAQRKPGAPEGGTGE